MSRFLFRIRNFVVLKDKNGFIVYNKNKSWENGHTHVNTVKMCRTIIDIVIHEEIPKTKDLWVYESVLRITSNSQKKYKKKIIQTMDEIVLRNDKEK